MANINPDPVGFPTWRKQYPIRAEDLAIIARQSQQMMRSAASDECDVGAGMGFQIGNELMPDGFWARLTAPPISESQPYFSFIEVQDDGSGMGWTVPNGAVLQNVCAVELNNNTNIDVPTAPDGLSVSPPGSTIFYAVTAIWQDELGNTYQGPAAEAGCDTFGGADLSWSAPPPYSLNNPPAVWPSATVNKWAVVGYQIWRGVTPGAEDTLIGTVSSTTLTFTDPGGGGTPGAPIPGGNAGPVVWMSTRSAWVYFKFYYPADPLPLAWVKATSATGQTVKLAGGGSLTVFSAVIDSFSDTSGSWSDGSACWFYEVNGNAPQSGARYQCRLVAMDNNGVPVFGSTATIVVPCQTVLLGPFVTNVTCSNNQMVPTQKWLCIPNGDVCCATLVDSPTSCVICPAPPPCPHTPCPTE